MSKKKYDNDLVLNVDFSEKNKTKGNDSEEKQFEMFLSYDNKFRDVLLDKLRGLEFLVNKGNYKKEDANKKIDEILDVNKKYFESVYKLYVDTILNVPYLRWKKEFEYAVLSNGKKLRPFLMFLVFYIFDGLFFNNIDIFMLSIELIHSFSLVHDDLPALDNDLMRRGRESVWKKFGEAEGILIGDLLLNTAYELLTSYFEFVSSQDIDYYFDLGIGLEEDDDFDNDKNHSISYADIKKYSVFEKYKGVFLMCINRLIHLVGMGGLIEGEYDDVKFEGKTVLSKKASEINFKKTGSLISVSLQIGAILALTDDDNVGLLSSIGYNLGLVYQLRDNLSDNLPENNIETLEYTEKTTKNINELVFAIKRNIDKLHDIDVSKKKLFKAFIDYIADLDV